MQIGYARVSTEDLDIAVQVAALKSAGCERMYSEKASGEVNFRAPSGVTPGPSVSVRMNYLNRPSNEVTMGLR